MSKNTKHITKYTQLKMLTKAEFSGDYKGVKC